MSSIPSPNPGEPFSIPVVGPIATIATSERDDSIFRVAAAFFTPEGEKKTKMHPLPPPDRALKRARF